jgi:DNA-binding LacI/PurR family transcriptional regulator
MSKQPKSPHGPAEPVTIYHVAEQAGVSITTVSNALNRPDRVGAATLARVMAVIDELGFTPKEAAVSRARKGVGRIGVLAPFTSYASYRSRLAGVLEACDGQAIEVVLFDQQSVAEASSPLLGSLPVTGRLDGVLIMGLPLKDAMARRLAQRQLAAVLVDSAHPDLSSVNVDDEAGGYLVGKYLVDQGHQTFAYVSERQRSTTFLSPGILRMRGFERALADAGLAPGAMRHVITSHDVDGGRRAAAEMIAAGNLPDALFAHFDDIAAGLLSGLRAKGVRVPEDVAVVGYDGTELADALDLTTVHQPFVESGRIATGLLLDQLNRKSPGVQHIKLPAQLIVRSTA